MSESLQFNGEDREINSQLQYSLTEAIAGMITNLN